MSEAAIIMPQSDTEAAIEFLLAFEPEGPWVPTAIPPHRKGIQTRTFHPHSIPLLIPLDVAHHSGMISPTVPI